MAFCLLGSAAAWADSLIALRYWRKNAGGTEQYTVLITLDKYFEQRFGDPVGLEPYLRRGRQRGDFVVDTLAVSGQQTYLRTVSQRADLYGSQAAKIAASIQQPEDIAQAPNSGVYVFSGDQLVLSFRVVAPKRGEPLPVIDTYQKKNGKDAPLPKVEEGLKWRKVAGVPPMLDAGVIDLSKATPDPMRQVFQKGGVEVKALMIARPLDFQLAPEIFNLTRWIFEYSPNKVPKGVKLSDDRPAEGGAFNAILYCDVYVNKRESKSDLKQLYERLGFTVWAQEEEENSDLVHYYMYATPESMGIALARVQRIIASRPGAALVEVDEDLLRRLNGVARKRKRDCKMLEAEIYRLRH